MGLLKAARGDWRKSGGYWMQWMGVIGCSKGLVEAKHRIRVENICRDSEKLEYLEK